MTVSIALYRRYRPQKFQEVIGQDHVVKPIMAALAGGRTTHAYLFSGPRGCGKTTSARILARCLNCVEYPTDTPCGKCPSCIELSREGSGSLDVVELDAASHGGVDDARDLREQAGFAPVRDRFKIFIIDEAHMVSNQGFNALLKLVEEPPEHVKFIFATTEPEKVIGTIRSRTHHYPFRLVPPAELEEYLAEICEREGITAGHDVLSLVVRAGTGSVRDTLSVLDQIIGGSPGPVLNYENAVALLGYTSAVLLDRAVEAIAARDGAALFGVVDEVVKQGHDPRRFVEDLLQRLRDLVIIALTGEQARDVFVTAPDDQYFRMVTQAEQLGAQRASLSADLVNDALSQMAGATAPRLQLELLCARLIVANDDVAAPAAPADRSEAGVPDLSRFKKSDSGVPRRPSGSAAGAGREGEASGGRADATGSRAEVTGSRAEASTAQRTVSQMDPNARPMPAMPKQVERVEASRPTEAEAAGADTDGRYSRSRETERDSNVLEESAQNVSEEIAQNDSEESAQNVAGADASASARPVAAPVPQADAGPLAQVKDAWQSLITDPGISRVGASQLRSSNGPAAVQSGVLLVSFEQPGLVAAFSHKGARELAQVLQNRGIQLQVEGRIGDEIPKAEAAQSAAAPASVERKSVAPEPAYPDPEPSRPEPPRPEPTNPEPASPEPADVYPARRDSAGLEPADPEPTERAAEELDAHEPAEAPRSALSDFTRQDFPAPPPAADPFGSPSVGRAANAGQTSGTGGASNSGRAAGAGREPNTERTSSAGTAKSSGAATGTSAGPAPASSNGSAQPGPKASVHFPSVPPENPPARFASGSSQGSSASDRSGGSPGQAGATSSFHVPVPAEAAPEPEWEEPDPEWEGASADDPDISQSEMVGLQAVLKRFDGKVIEEREN